MFGLAKLFNYFFTSIGASHTLLYLYDRQTQEKCLVLATYCVMLDNFNHLADLSEFPLTYDYMLRFHIDCLLTGMICYGCILIFDNFPLRVGYIGLTAFIRSSVIWNSDIEFRIISF